MRIGRIGLIVLLLAIALTATPSHAICAASYLMSTWGAGTTSVYNYIHIGMDPATATIKGSWWGAGEKTVFNNGTYDVSQWLVPYPAAGADAFYIYANTGDGGVIGCSTTNNVYVQLEALGSDGTYKFFLGGIDAIYANGVVWDFSRLNSDWNMQSLGRPGFQCQSVGSNCHVGGVNTPGTVNAMTFNQPPGISQAYYLGNIPNPVTQWRLLSKNSTLTTGVDTSAAGWTVAGTAPIGSPINFSWDDSTLPAGNLIHFAAQACFDNCSVAPAFVGGSGTNGSTAAFRGNSTLAHPGKFKNIDKGHGKGKK